MNKIFMQEVNSANPKMFVSRVGLNLCLTNEIHICRVPQSTNETQWSVLTFPKAKNPLHTSDRPNLRLFVCLIYSSGLGFYVLFTCSVLLSFGSGNRTLIDLFSSGRMVKHCFGRSLLHTSGVY